MEFPRNPSRRQRQRQQDVAIAIAGMQDVFLEPTPERLDEILETAYDLPEPGFNWQTLQTYLRPDNTIDK